MTFRHKAYITTSGTGQHPALFFHGLWGGGNYFRDFNFSSLPLGPLVFPDQLGFGKSLKPHINYTPKTHVKAIKESIPKQKYTLIGNSFGCILLFHFAYMYPEYVDRIIVISPVIHANRAEAQKYLSTRFIPRLTITHPRLASLICHTFCKTRILEMLDPFVNIGKRRVYLKGSTKHTWNSYYSTFANGFLNPFPIEFITNITNSIPTLLISGERDNYINPQTIKTLTGKKLTKRILPGTHQLFFEQNKRVLKIIGSALT